MNIGLVPMSAKPYHLGHHMLVELAALGALNKEIVFEAPKNDLVIVFVSYSSRGTKTSKGKEVVVPGETPVFGQDMRYIWENLLIPNLAFPQNVLIRTPSDGIPNSPVAAVFEVINKIHKSKVDGEFEVNIPYTSIPVDPNDIVLTIYSDEDDAGSRFNDDYMRKIYSDSYGRTIKKYGVPRSKTVEISGTKMRNLLCKDDKNSFIKMLPPLPLDVSNEIYEVLSTSATKLCPRKDWQNVNEMMIRKIVREFLWS